MNSKSISHAPFVAGAPILTSRLAVLTLKLSFQWLWLISQAASSAYWVLFSMLAPKLPIGMYHHFKNQSPITVIRTNSNKASSPCTLSSSTIKVARFQHAYMLSGRSTTPFQHFPTMPNQTTLAVQNPQRSRWQSFRTYLCSVQIFNSWLVIGSSCMLQSHNRLSQEANLKLVKSIHIHIYPQRFSRHTLASSTIKVARFQHACMLCRNIQQLSHHRTEHNPFPTFSNHAQPNDSCRPEPSKIKVAKLPHIPVLSANIQQLDHHRELVHATLTQPPCTGSKSQVGQKHSHTHLSTTILASHACVLNDQGGKISARLHSL